MVIIQKRLLENYTKDIGKSIEEDKKQKYYEEKAKDMNNSSVIYNDDPNALTKLKEKLEYLEKQRALIKADEEHQPWQLQNVGARIRETKRRIARLKNLEKIEFEDKEFVGGKVIHNKEINRIQFLFDEKPNEEVRNNLKHNGFHWSRNEGAWQREFNERTIKVTNNLVKEMFEKEQPKETESFEFEDEEEEM